ncbi:MAG TPA: neocarzinostatin apoprotein domain-containing protein [Candidatus Angelobacter sp.]|jgi:phosphate transport system substrate-binding protein|nr:neocarzinostatin apoprotein domain-containing protein [Candidatus Angelobacter sp.]
MRRRRTGADRLGGLLVVALLAAAVWTVSTVAPRAGATGGPTLTATPATSLVDGQFVKLAFSGLAPSSGIVFRECIASPTIIATDCTPVNTQVTGIGDATGAGTTYLPVYANGDQALQNSGKSGSIVCDQGHPCVIAGMFSATDLTTAMLTPVAFAPSPDACPAPGPGALLGGGGSAAYRAIYGWSSQVCTPPQSLSVGYAVNNSVDGVNSMFTGLTDFAVTGPLPPPPNQPPNVSYKLAPVTESALVLAYRMYDRRGPQITTLTMTPDLIAKTFLGVIPNWNATAAIRRLNPGVEFPPRVVPFVRADHEAESYVFTSWLAATDPLAWTFGPQQIFPIPGVGVTGVTGSANLGLAVVDPTTDFSGQGNIGFMDASTAAFYGLPTVQIKLGAGKVVAATPQTVARAVAGAALNSDGTITPNYASTDPTAYPMPLVSYMLAPTNVITPDRGVALAAFLKYAVQAGQSAMPPGYAPLDPRLSAEALQVAGLIPTSAPPTPAPTPAPAPVATPAPTAAPVFSIPPPAIAAQPLAILPVTSGPLAAGPVATPTPAPRRAATTPRAAAPLPSGPPPGDQAERLLLLAQPAASRLVLPGIAGLAVLALVAGAATQVIARRGRRVP